MLPPAKSACGHRTLQDVRNNIQHPSIAYGEINEIFAPAVFHHMVVRGHKRKRKLKNRAVVKRFFKSFYYGPSWLSATL